MVTISLPKHGRGSLSNPTGRFERLEIDWDDAYTAAVGEFAEESETRQQLKTEYFRDYSKSLIAYNDSPDVGFNASINPYRGCEHGCIYCYARPYHEYLGLSAGLDFESKIFVKEDAPELLQKELAAAKWQPQVVGISGVTDAYQPIERKLELTRRCLELFAEFFNPVSIITKSQLIKRDIDILERLAKVNAAVVFVSITTLDPELSRKMEPRAAQPKQRLATVKALAAAGIPVGVNVSPIIPGLTEHEMPAILKVSAEVGAKYAGFTIVRLSYGLKQLFAEWLEEHYPYKKTKVLSQIRSMHGGKLNDSTFKERMRGGGIQAEQIGAMFKLFCRQFGLNKDPLRLSIAAFQRPAGMSGNRSQLSLWCRQLFRAESDVFIKHMANSFKITGDLFK